MFLKIESLVFSDIVHDDSWPQYLLTEGGRFFKNNFGSPNFGQMAQNWPQNQVFRHFLKFGSLVFLRITYNDSFQQFITSSADKIYKKNFFDFRQMGQNQAQN